MRLLTVYALVKHKQTFLGAVQDALNTLGVYTETVKEAVDVRKWGTDYHLFALSHLFNRPIINYNTVHNLGHSFLGVSTVEQFAECFRSFEDGTQHQYIWCTNVHETLLSSGDINRLSLLPISIFNMNNYHWVAMLPISQSVMQHLPIPTFRSLKE